MLIRAARGQGGTGATQLVALDAESQIRNSLHIAGGLFIAPKRLIRTPKFRTTGIQVQLGWRGCEVAANSDQKVGRARA